MRFARQRLSDSLVCGFMKLSLYLSADRGRTSSLASAIGMSAAFVSQMASGVRTVSPATAVLIERATEGAVTRRDLRPHDWRAIWPELATTGGEHGS